MFGLHETATLCRSLGRRAGKPVYDDGGIPFRCRSQFETAASARGERVQQATLLRLFAEPFDVRVGDRVVLGDRPWTVVEIRPRRALRRIHHLEIIAHAAGGSGGGEAAP